MAKSCPKTKCPEPEECPEWIFTFADLVMLMMGFFVILWVLKPPEGKQGGSPEAELRRRAEGLLEDLGLGDQAAKLPSQLSGGQRQRVAIARALANRPRVILADEPTGNLDTKSAQTVFDIFARLAREKGTTVITVTHDEGLAAQTSRRVNLVDGRLVFRTT